MNTFSAPPINNFKTFKSYVTKYGFSLSNFYDIDFRFSNSTGYLYSLLRRSLVSPNLNQNTATTIGNDQDTVVGLMRAYAEECTIPGFQISTGDYRINNSPMFKYAYGIVNNEITFSFIYDADSEIRKVFDAWQNYIYCNVATNSESDLNNINGINNLGRTRYRDEYVCDIVVIKYERHASSKRNTFVKNNQSLNSFYPTKDIIPDFDVKNRNAMEFTSGFGKAKPVYSTKLINAFPTNISSIALSSGSSQLIKLQTTFEYETAITSGQVSGSVLTSGNARTISK
jgi:hypothetical protein